MPPLLAHMNNGDGILYALPYAGELVNSAVQDS